VGVKREGGGGYSVWCVCVYLYLYVRVRDEFALVGLNEHSRGAQAI